MQSFLALLATTAASAQILGSPYGLHGVGAYGSLGHRPVVGGAYALPHGGFVGAVASPVRAAPTTVAAPVRVAPTTVASPVRVAPTTVAAPVRVAPTTVAAPVVPTAPVVEEEDDDSDIVAARKNLIDLERTSYYADTYASAVGPLITLPLTQLYPAPSEPPAGFDANRANMGSILGMRSYDGAMDMINEARYQAMAEGGDRETLRSLDHQYDSAKWNKMGFALPLYQSMGMNTGTALTADLAFWQGYAELADDAALSLRQAEQAYYTSGRTYDDYLSLYDAGVSYESAKNWDDTYALYWYDSLPGMEGKGLRDFGNVKMYQTNKYDYDTAKDALLKAERAFFTSPTRANAVALELAEMGYERGKAGHQRGLSYLMPELAGLLGGGFGSFMWAKQWKLSAEMAELEAELAALEFYDSYGEVPYGMGNGHRGYGRRHGGLYGGLF